MSLEKNIIDYCKNKEDIQHWVNLKGEYRYTKIIEFIKKQKIESTWINVTYYIKYDKRILINSFKYIVFLEEFYKSIVFQNKKLACNKLLGMSFALIIDEYLSLGNSARYDDIDLETLEKEQKTIVEFRNCVVHNKILLNRLYNKKTLEETLNIFIKILPKTYREGFIKNINDSCIGLNESLWHINLSSI